MKKTILALRFLVLALLFAGVALVILTPAAQAQSADNNKVVVYSFWGDGCPHCATQKPFMQDLVKRYPQVDLRMFEVWYNDANRLTLEKTAKSFGFEPKSVPTTFIGTKYWVGFDDNVKNEIENTVKSCLQSSCPDAGKGALPVEPFPVGWVLLAVVAGIAAVGAVILLNNRRRRFARVAARRRKK